MSYAHRDGGEQCSGLASYSGFNVLSLDLLHHREKYLGFTITIMFM